jgi:hypothetical protein
MRFTVAIAVWGSEALLPHALQSVFAQAHPAAELRVYADGPAPAAAALVRELQSDFPVTFTELERRPGLHGNHLRRRILEEAAGSHVCFLGHDCLFYPTYLQTHADNLGGDRNGLSVVPIAYWRQLRKDVGQPRSRDLLTLRDGEIDLLCIAYPRELSLQVGCFAEWMLPIRCADFLSFDAPRRRTVPRFRAVPEQAAHF